MTKGDFDSLADVLKKHIAYDSTLTCLAKEIAEALTKHHPAFDKERFFLRCGFVNWQEEK